MTPLQKRVKLLAQQKVHPQKSPEWFKQRQTKITASEASSCLTKSLEDCGGYLKHFKTSVKMNGKQLNSFKSKEEFIVSKCLEYYGQSQYSDTIATLHGKRFEDVASKFYCNLKNVEIIEFGLLNHPTLNWIGASPDGITPDGVMLEIKCPSIRKIKPNEFPIYYWVQMQIQLEVCNLDKCDYIECSIKQVPEDEFYNIPEEKFPGIILRKPNTEEYIYPPWDIITVPEHIAWIDAQSPDLEPVFYFIDDHQLLTVERDKEWFKTVAPKMKQVFDVISYFQNNKDAWEKHYSDFLDMKNKKFNDNFNSTECVINLD